MRMRFISYLSLIVVAWGAYSYLNKPLLKFILFFLILLPIFSLIQLLFARYSLSWHIELTQKEGKRLESIPAALVLKNHSFFLFPKIKLFLTNPTLNEHFLITALPQVIALKKSKRYESIEFTKKRLKKMQETLSLAYTKLSETDYLNIMNLSKKERYTQKTVRYFLPKPKYFYQNAVFELPAMARGSVSSYFSFLPQHIGIYEIGSEIALIEDTFGFFVLPLKRKPETISFKVLPNREMFKAHFSHTLPAPQPTDLAIWNGSISSEVNALANIRNYRPGDRMKDVHWKVSAKKGELFVKEFEDPRKGSLLFLFDHHYPLSLDTDNLLDYQDDFSELSLALLEEFNHKEGPLVLRFGNKKTSGPGQNQPLLPFVHFFSSWPNETKLSHGLSYTLYQEFKTGAYRAIVIVTAELSASLIDNMTRILKQKSTRLILVFLESGDKNASIENSARIQQDENISNIEIQKQNADLIKGKEIKDWLEKLETFKCLVFRIPLPPLGAKPQSKTQTKGQKTKVNKKINKQVSNTKNKNKGGL